MQTFLPYPDFYLSASVLDNKRLGKQRVEAYHILKLIEMPSEQRIKAPWGNHPAVLMWTRKWEKGKRGGAINIALPWYIRAMCEEWIRRGFKDTILDKVMENLEPDWLTLDFYNKNICAGKGYSPDWLGDERLHASHRANLLRKDPVYYGRYAWTEDPATPYWWPTKNGF